GEVAVFYPWTADGAWSKRPKLSSRWKRKRGRIQEPQRIAGVQVRIDSRYEVWPQTRRRSRRKPGVVLTGDHVYRRPAEERHDRVQLPVSDHVSRKRTPTLERRQHVHRVCDEHVSAIQVGVASIKVVVERIGVRAGE